MEEDMVKLPNGERQIALGKRPCAPFATAAE